MDLKDLIDNFGKGGGGAPAAGGGATAGGAGAGKPLFYFSCDNNNM